MALCLKLVFILIFIVLLFQSCDEIMKYCNTDLAQFEVLQECPLGLGPGITLSEHLNKQGNTKEIIHAKYFALCELKQLVLTPMGALASMSAQCACVTQSRIPYRHVCVSNVTHTFLPFSCVVGEFFVEKYSEFSELNTIVFNIILYYSYEANRK